jgi:hypothetical protein
MATKKNKQARRLARKRKAQQPKAQQPKAKRRNLPSGQQVLLKRVQESEHLKNRKVIQSPSGEEKMSDVIHRFAEPLQDEDGDVPPNMIRFAILVWNASILKKGEREEIIKDIENVLPDPDEEMREIMISIIDMLLERKEKHFSDNKRFILDYHITETDNRVDLDVVSTLPKGYNPDL